MGSAARIFVHCGSLYRYNGICFINKIVRFIDARIAADQNNVAAVGGWTNATVGGGWNYKVGRTRRGTATTAAVHAGRWSNAAIMAVR
jgi:hypothetical protein